MVIVENSRVFWNQSHVLSGISYCVLSDSQDPKSSIVGTTGNTGEDKVYGSV